MATVSAPTSEDRRAQVLRAGTLGEMLKRARELRGLTLERIANETKIPQRHLEALERDNLAAIPSGFYRRAELRTYAQAIGLDQRLALAELDSALTPPEVREPREPRSSKAAASPLPYIAMAGVAIAVVAVLLGRAQPAPPIEPRVETPSAGVATPAASSPEQTTEILSPPQPAAATEATTEPAVAAPLITAPVITGTELVVTTEPEGARITVNGIGWGSSPARISYLAPGEKRIRVSKEGYAAVEQVLLVEEGRRQTLNIKLESAR